MALEDCGMGMDYDYHNNIISLYWRATVPGGYPDHHSSFHPEWDFYQGVNWIDPSLPDPVGDCVEDMVIALEDYLDVQPGEYPYPQVDDLCKKLEKKFNEDPFCIANDMTWTYDDAEKHRKDSRVWIHYYVTLPHSTDPWIKAEGGKEYIIFTPEEDNLEANLYKEFKNTLDTFVRAGYV